MRGQQRRGRTDNRRNRLEQNWRLAAVTHRLELCGLLYFSFWVYPNLVGEIRSCALVVVFVVASSCCLGELEGLVCKYLSRRTGGN